MKFLCLCLTALLTLKGVHNVQGEQCPENWLDCGNGKCVARLWVCDGENDCLNLKDEEDCDSRPHAPKCLSSQFRCAASHLCIPQSWQCDGDHDCIDESDEADCGNVTSCSGFRCRNHHCVPSRWRCDKQRDCDDGSDEEDCPEEERCGAAEFACASGACVPVDLVCDQRADCADGSDEGEHCGDACVNATCSQKCRSAGCYCDEGYSLAADNRSCDDVDECAADGFCSHSCRNAPGGYRCSCMDGYRLENRTCLAEGPEPLLVFSTMGEIRGRYLRSGRYFPIHAAFNRITAVDVDPTDSTVYWTDPSANGSSVYSSQIDGSQVRLVINNGLLMPEDLAVDYLAGNLYITDSYLRQVMACKQDGTVCFVLHSTDIERPRSVALAPSEGLLYWSDWGESRAGIYRSGMDGSRRTTLVSTDIKWPNGIALDHTTDRLFWCDAQLYKIESITLDGRTRKVILKDVVFHPYSLSVFEDTLFWTDWTTFSLDSCNKFNGRNQKVVARENGKHIMGVHVYHPVLKESDRNPCWSHTCSHMCVIGPLATFRCVCPPGFVLKDRQLCLLDAAYPQLFVTEESRIYHFQPEAVGSKIITEFPSQFHSIGGLAFDWKSKSIYVSDVEDHTIYQINTTTMTKRELVREHLISPEAVAHDWLGDNLYWLDSDRGTVEVMSLKSRHRARLLSNLTRPVAMALAPARGRMFVAFPSSKGPLGPVGMYDMDGKNVRSLSLISGLPVALALHPTDTRLYWADPKEGVIASVDYMNPLNSKVILVTGIPHTMSLALSDDYLYWSSTVAQALHLKGRNDSRVHSLALPGRATGAVARKVIYSKVEGANLPSNCSNNGGCSHLCLLTPKGKSCACPMGMQLDNDSATCTEKECEFRCRNGLCISMEFYCDGTKDCEDGSDERCYRMPLSRCPGTDFQCGNGRCVLQAWQCDHRNDCGDNTDENDCPAPAECANDQFPCANGECVASLWRCDGERDCGDASDEAGCGATTCSPLQLRCAHGQCIPSAWACDGAADCFDASDERDCATAPLTCRPTDFRCADGACIDGRMACDRRRDCEDGSDEGGCETFSNATCKEGMFRCPENLCIYDHEVCDSVKDCRNGEEEINCTRTECSAEEFYCAGSHRCIPRRWLCDGDDDCGDAADEELPACPARDRDGPPAEECEEFVCRSGECLAWPKVCDGHPDCYDLSDEGGACSDACRPNNGLCAQSCQKTPQGPLCSCYAGYALMADGKACEDVDECQVAGHCSQYCNNTKGGFKCRCASGYFLENDHRKCKADGGEATLVYLLPDQIRGIDLSSRAQRIYVSGDVTDMRGMDYDASEGIFFWSEWKEGIISYYTPDTNLNQVLVKLEHRPYILKWDWVSKNVYYTDSEGSIRVCSRDGKHCSIVVRTPAPHLNSMELEPTSGLLFWSAWSVVLKRSSGVIERAEMDGSHRTEIVSHKIHWPCALNVDRVMKYIYWSDAKLNTIEYADFHGLNRREVVRDIPYYPFSLALFEDFVYWTDWGTDSIKRCNRFTGKSCTDFHKGDVKAEALIVVHKVQQPKGENRCSGTPCPHLCLLTRTSYSCLCDGRFRATKSSCELTPTSTPAPLRRSRCPEGFCLHDAPCVVVGEENVCQCPLPYDGAKCETFLNGVLPVADYSWVVAVLLGVGFISAIGLVYLLCWRNREKLGESVAVGFRNFGRKKGRLVMDTDDGGATDELMLGQTGEYKQPGFGNPLFGKQPLSEAWSSYDSAFVGEDSSLPPITARIVQFFRRA